MAAAVVISFIQAAGYLPCSLVHCVITVYHPKGPPLDRLTSMTYIEIEQSQIEVYLILYSNNNEQCILQCNGLYSISANKSAAGQRTPIRFMFILVARTARTYFLPKSFSKSEQYMQINLNNFNMKVIYKQDRRDFQRPDKSGPYAYHKIIYQGPNSRNTYIYY